MGEGGISQIMIPYDWGRGAVKGPTLEWRNKLTAPNVSALESNMKAHNQY